MLLFEFEIISLGMADEKEANGEEYEEENDVVDHGKGMLKDAGGAHAE